MPNNSRVVQDGNRIKMYDRTGRLTKIRKARVQRLERLGGAVEERRDRRLLKSNEQDAVIQNDEPEVTESGGACTNKMEWGCKANELEIPEEHLVFIQTIDDNDNQLLKAIVVAESLAELEEENPKSNIFIKRIKTKPIMKEDNK